MQPPLPDDGDPRVVGHRRSGAMTIATVIVCVDCGGRAHLVQAIDPDDPPEPGDIVTYRCEDCTDRWDLVVEEADLLDP